jgi:hypothetical protein
MRRDGFTSINSGHLDGVKYDSFERKLTVRFQNGYEYDVHDVLPKDHEAFMAAASQGEHYHQVIKPNFHITRSK